MLSVRSVPTQHMQGGPGSVSVLLQLRHDGRHVLQGTARQRASGQGLHTHCGCRLSVRVHMARERHRGHTFSWLARMQRCLASCFCLASVKCRAWAHASCCFGWKYCVAACSSAVSEACPQAHRPTYTTRQGWVFWCKRCCAVCPHHVQKALASADADSMFKPLPHLPCANVAVCSHPKLPAAASPQTARHGHELDAEATCMHTSAAAKDWGPTFAVSSAMRLSSAGFLACTHTSSSRIPCS